MSIDAYKIAVQVSLVENVTRGLASLSGAFKRTDGDAAALQKRLDSIAKLAIGGAVLTGAGVAIGKQLTKTLDEAKKYQQEMGKLRAQGTGDYEMAQADKFAKAQKIMGASASDTMKMLSESNSVLRDFHHAQEVTPLLLKMKFGMESVMGDGHGAKMEQQFMAALKVAELRGALNDPISGKFDIARFSNTLDFMTKAYAASGGLVKPSEYLNLIKTGGVAAKGLSDQSFYFGLMHMMQESGGNRVGTSLMSGFQNMYMGRTTQQVAEEMNRAGLLNADKLHYGKTGHLTKLDPASLSNAELFRTDQFRYMNEVMLPKLREKGVKEGVDMETAIATLFSNRTASNLWTTMYKERFNIQKHTDQAQNALGINGLAKQGSEQYAGKLLDYEARMADLKLQLGETILPAAIKGLEGLTALLTTITDFSKDWPNFTKFLMVSVAAIAGVAVLGGGVMLVAAGAALLGVGIGSVALAAGGAIVALTALIGGFVFFDDIKNAFKDFSAYLVRGFNVLFGGIVDMINKVLPEAMKITKPDLYGAYLVKNNAASYSNEGHGGERRQTIMTGKQQQSVQVINRFDERGITSMVARNIGKEMIAPARGILTFDQTMSPMPVGGR